MNDNVCHLDGLTCLACFQHLMEICLTELQLTWCIIYLDDIMVFAETPQEHLQWLRAMFLRLRKAGLKLKPNKCKIFCTEIVYLANIISQERKRTDEWKIKAVLDWSWPNTVTEVCSFLGFANYYWQFLKNYAKIANTLYILILGDNDKLKK